MITNNIDHIQMTMYKDSTSNWVYTAYTPAYNSIDPICQQKCYVHDQVTVLKDNGHHETTYHNIILNDS